MDLIGLIQKLNLFDILVALFVAGFSAVGYIQGALRRVLGLAIVVASLLVALVLRDPLGTWLAQYWTLLPRAYVYMLAFGGTALTIYLAGSVAVQTFYRRTNLFTKTKKLDEVVGAALGALQAIVIVGALILILDSYFHLPDSSPDPAEMAILRDTYNFYSSSQVVELFRGALIPFFLAVFGWIARSDLRETYR